MNSYTCVNALAYHKWAIGNDIRELLSTNSAITAIVGSNIYPIVAPEKTEGEFILYSREKYSKHYTKMGIYEDECLLRLTVISNDYDTSIALAAEIDRTLTGYHTKATGEKIEISLEDSNELYDDSKYIQNLIFDIK